MVPLKYRPEIDGLRTVAVLPVILFHAGAPAFHGGYVGVDVFFVISGYLITSLLIAEIELGEFSLLRFYERRIRRILPALFTVMAASIPLAFLVLLPNDLVDFGESLIAVPLFVSNLLFWSERGYFGAATELKSLVHTWSLAVEEQFYILYPPVLALLMAAGARLRASVLWLVFALSLLASWYLTRLHFETGFYLPVTRAWELLSGAFCAFLLARNRAIPAPLQGPASGLGLLLIGYAVFSFDNSTVFPGIAAAIPVLGAVLVILSRAMDNPVHRLLSWRPVVFVGLLSYALYLWHQPVFAFLRHLQVAPWVILASLPLVFLASFLSYRFIETPLRRTRRLDRRQIFGLAMIGSLSFILAGAAIVLNRGFESRYDPRDVAIMRQFPDMEDYSETRFNAAEFRPFGDTPKRKVLIAGDSHARDFYNTLLEAGLDDRFQFSTKRINSECGNLHVERDLSEFISALREERCRVMGRFERPELQPILAEADEVWLVARWHDWVIDLLPETIARLERDHGLRVRVFGPKNFGATSLEKALAIPAEERPRHRQAVDRYFLDRNEQIARVVPADHLTLLMDPFCQGDHENCRLFTDEGLLVTTDGAHMTRAGAIFLAPVLRELVLGGGDGTQTGVGQ